VNAALMFVYTVCYYFLQDSQTSYDSEAGDILT